MSIMWVRKRTFFFLVVLSFNCIADDCVDDAVGVSVDMAIIACESKLPVAGQLSVHQGDLAYLESTIYLRLAQLHLQKRDYDRVDVALASAKNARDYSVNETGPYHYYRYQALKYWYKKELSTAEDYASSTLKLAEGLADESKIAKAWNELAVIKNAKGLHKEALELLEKSLRLKQKNKDVLGQAVSLSNLGLTQMKLAAYSDAEVYYQQALALYAEFFARRPDNAQALQGLTHLYEDLVLLYTESGQPDKKAQYVQLLVSTFDHLLNHEEQLRVLSTLMQSHVRANRLAPAREMNNQIEKLMLVTPKSSHLAPLTAQAQLAFANGDVAQAKALAKEALSLIDGDSGLGWQVENLALIAKAVTSQSQSDAITRAWEHYLEKRELQLRQQFDADLGSVNARILREQLVWQLEKNRLESERAQLSIERLRFIIIAAVLMLALFVMALSWLIVGKRRQQLALQQEIEGHRHQLWLLQQGNEINEVFSDASMDEIEGHANTSFVCELNAEHCDPQEVECNGGPTPVAPSATTIVHNERPNFDESQFRLYLVEAMVDCVRLWEKSTHTNRVELADSSQIWKVSIDDGRLRTRSLDKYLSIDKLPQQPRWRGVVQTCHYVLAECSLSAEERKVLNAHLNRITTALKVKALQAD